VGPGASLYTLDKRNLLTDPGIEPRLLGLPACRVVTMLANNVPLGVRDSVLKANSNSL